MSRRIFLTGSLLASVVMTVFAQKPPIDSSVFDKWSRVGQANISKYGNYVAYYDFIAVDGGEPVMVVQAMHQQWKMSFKGVRSYHMLQDGKHLVFQSPGDSLFIMEMGTKKRRYIARVNDYQVIGKEGKEWLCYESHANSGGQKKLTLYSIRNNKQSLEDSIADHWFNELGDVMIVKKKVIDGPQSSFTWEWHNLGNGVAGKIWEGEAMLNPTMDAAGRQLVFTTPLKEPGNYELWYYQEGMIRAEPRVVNGSPYIDSNLRLDNSLLIFSRDGHRIFFSLTPKKEARPSSEGVQVDIWSYRDPVLEEAQVHGVNNYLTFMGWMNVDTAKSQQLEKNGLHLYDLSLERRLNKVLLRRGGGDDVWWRGRQRDFVCLSSLQEKDDLSDGLDLLKTWTNSDGFRISPQEKYILYHDPVGGEYYSYEIAGGQIHNITEDLRTAEGPSKGEALFIAGWFPKGQAVLLYDNWDIWRVDPQGVEQPENLTHGYGRLHHIRLRLSEEAMHNGILDISSNKELLLAAFDTATKHSGYYRLRPGKEEAPTVLTMGPYRYIAATKATSANVWLVLRESAEEAPNYYYTNDWVHFHQITNVAPQKRYNWLTAELVTWPLPDGNQCQGMLFKPENLDVHKKYPLLVHYYEAPSDELYYYRDPKATWDVINIPYFVSRGYVVFVPDIHYRSRYAGESALASVVSGARYLSKLPWIDSTRMGLQGHSFGGYETNYIITHSNLFAAAEEGSGVSDMISDYNGIVSGGSNQGIFEVGQYRMLASLWENADIYIKGSPIFNADKVITPLLMMHNKQDDLVPWQQGVEFFSALRRCGKKVWMLQYDRGKHFVQPGQDALDYTIRIEQFFDYYLKDALPPKWMTEGVPAIKKGWETGYELDTSGKVP